MGLTKEKAMEISGYSGEMYRTEVEVFGVEGTQGRKFGYLGGSFAGS